MIYRIKDWNKHYEKAVTRRYINTRWVSIPNKHDGKGYRRIVQHERSVEIFSAWILIVQVASKMPTRGVLRDEDGPITADDLEAMTGFPESIFKLAFAVLIDPKIGWLELVTDDIEMKNQGLEAKNEAF